MLYQLAFIVIMGAASSPREMTDTFRPKTFIVDDYPVMDRMMGSDVKGDERAIKSGPILSQDKVWFTNDSLQQTLVFELYTDGFRNVTFHFLNNDIPPGLIKRMELNTPEGDTATNLQKMKYFRGFLSHSRKIRPRYFVSNKGFRLGDGKEKAIRVYGRPDKQSVLNGIATLEWDFVGDADYDGKMKLKGKPLAEDNYGHTILMYFRDNRLIGLILHNDIP